jgi:hypothetical protein
MAAHPAFALDGPLEGSLGLMVEDHGECEGWPCEVAWTDPEDGEEYVYRFESVSISRQNVRPVYTYVPTDEI